MFALRFSGWCLLLFVLSTAYVHAGISYTAQPLVIDETLEPRDIKEHTVTLTNTGTTPVTIYPTVNNIALDAGGAIQEFVTPVMSDQTTSLAAWLEISRAGIDIKPGETKTAKIIIRVNPLAAPGKYHALVGFPQGNNRDEAERLLERGDAQGTIVTVIIGDNRVSLLKLARFVVDRFVTSSHNNAASFVIRNPGDEVLTPNGEIIFYTRNGEEVGSVPVNASGISIAPGAEHTFAHTVPTQGLFGKYKAFLSVDYGTKQIASVQDTAFFYVVPLRFMLIGGIILILMVIVISLFMHKRYFDEGIDDGSELLPVHVRVATSDAKEHDIDLRNVS